MARMLTTLEEDMIAIGLLPKAAVKAVVEQTDAPKVEEPKVEEPKAAVEEECDDEEEEDDDEEMDDDEEEDDDVEEDVDAVEDGVTYTEEEIEEAVKRLRTKKGSSADRAKWRKVARKGKTKTKRKKHLRRASVKKLAKKRDRMKRGRTGTGRVRLVVQGMDRVGSLLDDVQKILNGDDKAKPAITAESRVTLAKNFAQLALTADLLATKFESVKDEDIDDLLPELIADLKEISEQYGSAALKVADGSLNESEDDLVGAFEVDLKSLLDALEVYDLSVGKN